MLPLRLPPWIYKTAYQRDIDLQGIIQAGHYAIMPLCHHAVKDFVVVKTRPKRRFATRHGQQPPSPELLMARRSVSFLLYFVFSSPKRRVYNNYRENNFIYVLFPKRKRQLYKMSAKTGDFRIQMRITGVENAKTYIPQFTLVDFEQSLKRK